MPIRPRHLIGTVLLTTALVAAGAPGVAVPIHDEPATAAPAVPTATDSTSAAEQHGRECVEGGNGVARMQHGGDATYFDDQLEDPSCAGVPMDATGFEKCKDGMAGIFPCDNVNLGSFLPLSDMEATWANDLWGWTDPETGSEYALVGLAEGTGFVDVTKPRHPVYLGQLPAHTDPSTWRDIEVVDDHAFIVSEAAGHGMQVFDLSRLRGRDEPKTFSEDAWLGGFGQAHTVTAHDDTGFVYVNGSTEGVTVCDTGGGGPIMVDVSRPKHPEVVGCNPQDGYTHDMQCVLYTGPDADHDGREICLGSNEDTLTVTDVTDKDDPEQLSRTPYDTAAYVHQGWLTPNQRYFLSNDELDETFGEVPSTTTYMWDLKDLDNPVVMGGFEHGTESIDHQLFIRDGYAFESNYMSGVRILRTKKLSEGDLSKKGHFDSYPIEDAVDFAGSWANYPFFTSGTVIGTGMEEGLFVLRPTGKIAAALQRSSWSGP